jgi:hypothetical protein
MLGLEYIKNRTMHAGPGPLSSPQAGPLASAIPNPPFVSYSQVPSHSRRLTAWRPCQSPPTLSLHRLEKATSPATTTLSATGPPPGPLILTSAHRHLPLKSLEPVVPLQRQNVAPHQRWDRGTTVTAGFSPLHASHRSHACSFKSTGLPQPSCFPRAMGADYGSPRAIKCC